VKTFLSQCKKVLEGVLIAWLWPIRFTNIELTISIASYVF
jgi:hypothetical protein